MPRTRRLVSTGLTREERRIKREIHNLYVQLRQLEDRIRAKHNIIRASFNKRGLDYDDFMRLQYERLSKRVKK